MIVREIINSIKDFVTNLGYLPLDVMVIKRKDSYEISFAIFKKGGVTIKDCEKVTLFTRDFLMMMLGKDFSIDVSSPGAERVLKDIEEFNIFVDNKAKVVLKDGEVFTGLLKGTTDDKNVLLLEHLDNTELVRIKVSDIAKCKLTI